MLHKYIHEAVKDCFEPAFAVPTPFLRVCLNIADPVFEPLQPFVQDSMRFLLWQYKILASGQFDDTREENAVFVTVVNVERVDPCPAEDEEVFNVCRELEGICCLSHGGAGCVL